MGIEAGSLKIVLRTAPELWARSETHPDTPKVRRPVRPPRVTLDRYELRRKHVEHTSDAKLDTNHARAQLTSPPFVMEQPLFRAPTQPLVCLGLIHWPFAFFFGVAPLQG